MTTDAVSTHVIDSERIVLNALEFHPEWLEAIQPFLPESGMFYNPMHDRLYGAMLDLASHGQPFDILLAAHAAGVAVHDALDVISKLPSDFWLTAVVQKDLCIAHARLIQEAWIKRETYKAASRKDGVLELSQRLQKLASQGLSRSFDSDDLAMLLIAESSEQTKRLPYPFGMWQHASGGGVRPDELIIVAARPGVGKSVMLSQWAWQLASSGKRVLLFSAEMSAKSLTTRIASHITHRNLDNPKISEDLEAIDVAADAISRASLRIEEITSTAQIEASIKRLKGDVDVVFIDYLQQLMPMARANGEFEQVTAITRELDTMSMKYGLPFVVASQYSRNAQGGQPSMSDLRSSGQIEQAADVIISLWSKPEEAKEVTRSKVYVDVLKNRNGYTIHNTQNREYALWLNKPIFTFSEISNIREEVK